MVIKLFNKVFIFFLLTICLVLLLNLLGWVKLLVVKTGSMQPKIPINSLVVVVPQKSIFNQEKAYKVGEVISFHSTQVKELITHRIVGLRLLKDRVYYQTKGDANQSPDPSLRPASAVLGKMFLSLPFLGIFIGFLSSLLGLFILVIIPATFVILHEVLVILEELRKTEKDNEISVSKKTITGPILIILILVLATPVYALFNSQVFLTSNSLSTKDFFENIPNECSGIRFSGNPIVGTNGNDILVGTSGNDLIFGQGGDDNILAGSGEDCVVAGTGNDKVWGGSGNDVLFGNDGEDVLQGGSGGDKLFGELGNDTLFSGSGDDIAKGDENDDIITGGSGRDSLNGGPGIDTLNGSTGIDTCLAGEIVKNCEGL